MSGLRQLRAAARLIARGYAARKETLGAAPESPRRRQAVERRGIQVTATQVARYRAATAGAGLRDDGDLPPLYACTWETLLALELLAELDPALPLGAMIHTGSEILVPRRIAVGEPLACRVELERAEPLADGVRIQVAARNWAAAGQLATESHHTFRLRTGQTEPRTAPPLEMAGWTPVADWSLPGGAGRRYARASGDWNPIHLWPLTARALGFRRPILHGFCTAAMVAHAAADTLCAGDGSAIRRMRIAFRAPLGLPGQARLWLSGEGSSRAFRVTDAAGEKLHAEGDLGLAR